MVASSERGNTYTFHASHGHGNTEQKQKVDLFAAHAWDLGRQGRISSLHELAQVVLKLVAGDGGVVNVEVRDDIVDYGQTSVSG